MEVAPMHTTMAPSSENYEYGPECHWCGQETIDDGTIIVREYTERMPFGHITFLACGSRCRYAMIDDALGIQPLER